MRSLSIRQVVKAVNGKLLNSTEDSITGISIDSRSISKGDLFIPIKGENFDGHDFIEQSVSKGATAYFTENKDIIHPKANIILVENTIVALHKLAYYYRREFNIPFIAITGSSGKTTTKDMIASVLEQKFNILKTQGNFNNEIGLPLTLFQLESCHQIAVIEMGMSNLGEISRLVNMVHPDIAVITNIGLTHIENLGSQENIFRAKREILETLSSEQIALLNGDDPYLSTIHDESFKPFFLGIDGNQLDFKADQILTQEMGISYHYIDLKNGDKEYYQLNLPGIHNVYNSMFAIFIGRYFGLNRIEIQKGLNLFKPSKMRMDITYKKDLKIINDAYNANPDSMKAALDVLSNSEKNRRKIAILGDMLEMGEWAREAHVSIGRYLADHKIDILIGIGNEARYYIEGAQENGMPKDSTSYFQNNNQAIEYLSTLIDKHDIVLIKGSRGMKLEQIVTFLQERG